MKAKDPDRWTFRCRFVRGPDIDAIGTILYGGVVYAVYLVSS